MAAKGRTVIKMSEELTSQGQEQERAQPEQSEAGQFDLPDQNQDSADQTPATGTNIPETQQPQFLRYLGGGALVGVPARDVSLKEAGESGLDLENILASGHYRLENE